MKDKIANVTKWILYILLAFVTLLGLLFYVHVLSVGSYISLSILLLLFGVVIMIVSPVYGFISHPKNALKLLASLVLLVVIVIISYSLAGNQFSALRLEEMKTTAQVSKLVGMGLYATYSLFGIAVLAVIFSFVIKPFK
ncbi:MAG TPA: hypothetical protein ENH02_02045 [Bacteroidetes bacterium]|nr:hypothetical protein [Bacteroidota bacterium]